MTPICRRMDPSTLEDILIHKFNTDLQSAQLVQIILQEEKDRNNLCTPVSESTLTTATDGSSSAAVNIFEDMDEDNANENVEADVEASFDRSNCNHY